MCRLQILYAVFFLCYGLRTAYQFELGDFRNWKLLQSQAVRYYWLNALPLIWDILSITSILMMHYFVFNEKCQYSEQEDQPATENNYENVSEVNVETSSWENYSYRKKQQNTSSIAISDQGNEGLVKSEYR